MATPTRLCCIVSDESFKKLKIKGLIEKKSMGKFIDELCEPLDDYEVHVKKPSASSRKSNPQIYFLQNPADRTIKIGYSKSPDVRIQALQTGSSQELQLLGLMNGDKTKERSIHRRFAAHNIGGEWFKPAEELVDFINENTTT